MTEQSTAQPHQQAQPPQHAPQAQAKYQVRFDWGTGGARAIGQDADIVVWVDVLAPADAGEYLAIQELLATLPASTAVVAGGLTTASVVAAWILDEQVRIGRRAMVSIVAAGSPTSGDQRRFAVEDQLGAGAVIDALAAVGIDYASPEAAVACAAFTGLRGAVAHLLTASVSGQEQIAAGRTPAEIAPYGRVDTESSVNVLRGGTPSE
ncbi:2-phosphosulfolactate phosphatase [Leifsonia poae]|uniref:2-phosphosulfolactate phosphatase n=1 Tax=Leifsonia poae TaxID=110933 RepID=UPI003D67B9B0